MLAAHHYDLSTEVRVTQQMIQHGVDAFVFVGLDHDRALYSLLERYGKPYVLTWGVDASGLHPSIGFDNRAATYAMTRYLIDLGHRRFGLISAPTAGNDRSRERGAGVRAALATAGLTLDDDAVRITAHHVPEDQHEGGDAEHDREAGDACFVHSGSVAVDGHRAGA